MIESWYVANTGAAASSLGAGTAAEPKCILCTAAEPKCILCTAAEPKCILRTAAEPKCILCDLRVP